VPRLSDAAIRKYVPDPNKRRLIKDNAARGLLLVVHPSGARSFMMRFRQGAKIAQIVLGPLYTGTEELSGDPVIGMPQSLSSARQLAAEVLRARAQGRDPVAEYRASKLRQREEKTTGETSSFGACVRRFIVEYRVKKSRTRPRRWYEAARLLGLAYPANFRATADRDLSKLEPEIIKDSLASRWADKPVADIDEADVIVVLDEAKRSAVPGIVPRQTGLSDSRLRSFQRTLSTFFDWAKSERLIKVNPMRELSAPNVPASRERVLSSAEVRWFWRACDSVGEPFGSLFRALLLSGARLRELAELRRNELSDDGTAINLPSTRTKNKLPFTLPLAPATQQMIASAAKQHSACPFVFTTNGTKPVTGWSRLKARLDRAMLAEAKKERGDDVAIPHFRLHDLRRTAVTHMSELGIAPHIVEACVNHVSGHKGGVAGVYNRAEYAAEKRAAFESWATHVVGLVSNKPTNVTPIRKKKGA
jgi:integrase